MKLAMGKFGTEKVYTKGIKKPKEIKDLIDSIQKSI
jgi:hypothetical protein